MTSLPTYSVVIPCFNSHEYLGQAIESALNQTVRPSEVIVVDDGSTDPVTVAALDRIEQDYPLTVLHKENGGLSSARNAGIDAVSADVVLPLDADDLLAPRYAELALARLSEDLHQVVYGQARFCGAEEGPWRLPPFSPGRLMFENMIYATAFFPRRAWESVGGYDERLRHGREDHDFWIRTILGEQLGVQRVPETVFYYRQHGQSMNRDLGRDRAKLLDTYAHIWEKNLHLFGPWARDAFLHHLELVDERNTYRLRYGRIERRLRSQGPLAEFYRGLKSLKDHARRLRGT